MSRRALQVAPHELALIRSEWSLVLASLAMRVVLIAFVKNTFRFYLRLVELQPQATGAELAVPGQATMFGFMALSVLGYFFLGEHSWGTWNRMRSAGLAPREIV